MAPDLEDTPAPDESVTSGESAVPAAPKAGRPLGAATAVALLLLAMLAASLLLNHYVFVALLAVGIVIGINELNRALSGRAFRIPFFPLLLGGVAMPFAAYADGPDALIATFGLTVLAVLAWRLVEGGVGVVRDCVAGVMVAAYVPLLGSFLALLAIPTDDGAARVLTVVLVTTASDTGGYLVGVLFGKHPMAPTVSPKKSWEGFAGSVVACLAVGVLCVTLFVGGPWWAGLLLGGLGVIAATVGDLAESLIKRDLGIKDMGTLLPGHGGLLDRVDSLLVTAPIVWMVLDQIK